MINSFAQRAESKAQSVRPGSYALCSKPSSGYALCAMLLAPPISYGEELPVLLLMASSIPYLSPFLK